MNKITQKGFTLLEVIIATGILVMLLTLIAGILSRHFVAQRIQIAQADMQEDVRFALELMTREIRTGYGSTFVLPDSTGSALTLRNQNGVCVEYRLNAAAGQIERSEKTNPGDTCDASLFDDSSFVPLTSHSTFIQFLRFDPIRTTATSEGLPDRQGFVSISLKAAPRQNSKLTMQLQTTATSRQIILYTPQ